MIPQASGAYIPCLKFVIVCFARKRACRIE